MTHFFRLPSVIQIFFAEFMMTIFLGGLAPYAYRAVWPRQLSYTPPSLDWSDAAFGAVGLALLAWLMWGPMFPRVADVSWTPVFRSQTSNAVTVMPGAGIDYGFVTNHPSYVCIDAVVIGFWWFIRVAMSDGDPERLYEANLWVSVPAIIPAWRLICWYVLRRRPAEPDAEFAIRDAWKPVAHLYGWFVLPLLALFAGVYFFG